MPAKCHLSTDVVNTPANGGRVSIAINHVCDSWLSVSDSVCPHDKTKTTETKIAKQHRDSPSRYLAHQ